MSHRCLDLCASLKRPPRRVFYTNIISRCPSALPSLSSTSHLSLKPLTILGHLAVTGHVLPSFLNCKFPMTTLTSSYDLSNLLQEGTCHLASFLLEACWISSYLSREPKARARLFFFFFFFISLKIYHYPWLRLISRVTKINNIEMTSR